MVTPRQTQPKYGVVGATRIVGETVVDRQGRQLGKIHELVLDAREGRVAYAVLAYGSKQVAVPWRALEFSNTEEKLVLDAASGELEAAPGFDKKVGWPERADQSRSDPATGQDEPG